MHSMRQRLNRVPAGKRTTGVPPTAYGSSLVWNEQFAILVQDPQVSQLELTLWDVSAASARRTMTNLLGEAVINLDKLASLNGQLVEHDFDIRCREASLR